jgi:hypothetical protein
MSGEGDTSKPSLLGREIRTIYDMLDVIRVRSGMWIGDPEITRLNAFIDGFRTGLNAAHVMLEPERPPFADFHAWIANRLGRRLNGYGWSLMLLEACGSEKAAFERFWLELDAFRAGGPSSC